MTSGRESPLRKADFHGAAEFEDFESLLESFEQRQSQLKPGDVVTGKVLSIKDNYVYMDIDLKCEGKIPVDQVRREDFFADLRPGQSLEVLVESIEEDEDGYITLSYEKVSRAKLFDELEVAFLSGRMITGTVREIVKGGLMVDIGVRAFLPGSQIDLHPARNVKELLRQTLDFKIIQFNRLRRNVVVSRRAVLEAQLEKLRQETIVQLYPGQIVTGTVKNITEYGVFMNLGGVDGLLHKTDISWGRVNHPGDYFQLGQKIRVMVLHFDPESRKVSLGYKQMEPDPWKAAEERITPGLNMTGRIQSIAPYGIFVEVERGIEGLVHISEISWGALRPESPLGGYQAGDEVKVQVLAIDVDARRLSLSIRKTRPNPWDAFLRENRRGAILDGKIIAIDEAGLLVEVLPGLVGRVHRFDITWNRDIPNPTRLFKIGSPIRVVVLDFNPTTHRLMLGVKQLEEDGPENFFLKHHKGDLVSGVGTRRADFGVFVQLAEGVEGLCRLSEPGGEAIEEPPPNLELGQEVRMKIVRLNPHSRKIGLSFRLEEAPPAVEMQTSSGSFA